MLFIEQACDIWSMGVIMYILLFGIPPFYSNDDNNQYMSTSMKRKIRAGEYEFQGKHCKNVSEDAKSTIKRMLTVDPSQCITIEEILNCSWLAEPVSDRPIDVSSLRDRENWNLIQVSANYSLSF